jgi:ferredoxin-NADP reductase
MTLEAADEWPAAYEPGHVLALGVNLPDGYIRHAYTVSRGEPHARRFGVLYRVIPNGRLSPRFAALAESAPVWFYGPFHTPIQQEIQPDAERIVLMGTGVGVGPIAGYAEKALAEGETRLMSLYASFRDESEVCLARELDRLAECHANFEWRYTITRPSSSWRGLTGRLTELVPDLIENANLQTYHFHLVGNGNMVHLMRQALYRAGVLARRISIETYFNHYAAPRDAEIDELARRFGAFNDLQAGRAVHL